MGCRLVTIDFLWRMFAKFQPQNNVLFLVKFLQCATCKVAFQHP